MSYYYGYEGEKIMRHTAIAGSKKKAAASFSEQARKMFDKNNVISSKNNEIGKELAQTVNQRVFSSFDLSNRKDKAVAMHFIKELLNLVTKSFKGVDLNSGPNKGLKKALVSASEALAA